MMETADFGNRNYFAERLFHPDFRKSPSAPIEFNRPPGNWISRLIPNTSSKADRVWKSLMGRERFRSCRTGVMNGVAGTSSGKQGARMSLYIMSTQSSDDLDHLLADSALAAIDPEAP